MPKYSHVYSVAFSLESDHAEGEDVTPEMLRAALMKRVSDLDAHGEWEEAVGCPIDSCESIPVAE